MYCTNFIPSEIIEAILLRLPPQSLGRFKSVSKEWNSVISHPRFIKTHQLLHQPKLTKRLLAISKYTNSLYSIELTIDNDIHGIPATTAKEITFGLTPPVSWTEILGSCNGLVLAIDVNNSMFLMNPTTLDLWKLPDNPLVYHSDMRYGFGYDSSIDDYKVVCFYYGVSIYSLRNNSWRKLPITPPYHVDHDGSFALVNGNCHWLAKYPSPSIVAFSFVDELFSKIKPPDSILDLNLWCTNAVVEIGGRLGVYLCLRSDDYGLWVMQEYGDAKSWNMVFTRTNYMRPMCFLEGSDRDIVIEDSYGDGLVVFNIDNRRDSKVHIAGGPSHFNSIGGTFVESIESIKRIITTP